MSQPGEPMDVVELRAAQARMRKYDPANDPAEVKVLARDLRLILRRIPLAGIGPAEVAAANRLKQAVGMA